MSTRGLEADVAALIAQDDVSPAGGEQLALEIFDDFLSPVAEQLARRHVRRGPGRPPGSKNRDNVNTIRLIKASKRPSILTLKEIVDLPFDDFMAAYAFTDREKAFGHWRSLLELMVAYEEGRPTQRVELDGKVELLPVVLFGDTPVRPDLVDGNPPDDGDMLNVTDWKNPDDTEGSQDDDGEGAWPKAHDEGQDAD
jgi:hypothetical protein